ncbi:MAG TPA: HAD hydrolase-like protein [Thauera sp.]|uniref:HAD family hydrolase n=1 Tax=Thauera sp. TaxID=1905334 RepID=UPI001D5938FB|nr:HAD family hydrolase [Thauera sp.]MCB1946957.1 HAD family hydrolase [Thauera sp.]MCP5223835.1 HAD family hydrolase [Thauera sp.]HRV76977.1 HAD hydrolase-like protein [Thauera sp.]
MTAYRNPDRLVIFDADGTTIDAFHAVEQSFLRHGMAIGDLQRFQKRRRLFKYLGGLREFPNNLRRQFGKQSRKRLLATLTGFYRDEARLYPGIAPLLQQLLDAPEVRVGLVTRNVTVEPAETLRQLFRRHDIDLDAFDHLACLSLREDKTPHFRQARDRLGIHPARCYACGDEYSDYLAALGAGMYPFIVAYGAEDRQRLTDAYGVPDAFIHASPAEFADSLRHALGFNADGDDQDARPMAPMTDTTPAPAAGSTP